MVANPKIDIAPDELFTDEIGQHWSPARIELSWPSFPGLGAGPSIAIGIVALARPEMTSDELRQAHIGAAHDVLSSALLALERTEHSLPARSTPSANGGLAQPARSKPAKRRMA